MHPPRIAVLGAGSIGCFVGCGWQDAGFDITLIGRPWLVEVIRDDGVKLTDFNGWETQIAPGTVAVTTEPAALGQADIVVLTVKCTASEQAAGQIAAHARPDSVIISLQNGISNVARLRGLLPAHTVLAGMVPFNVAYLGSGHWHKGSIGEIAVDAHPVTQDLAARLTGTPWSVHVTDNMPGVAWGKLLLNLNNAVNALSGLTLLQQLSDRRYRRVVAAAIREAQGVLRTAGIEPAKAGALPPALLARMLGAPDWFFHNVGLRLQKIDSNARSSMADDFAHGRPTEIDYLNGEVVSVADRLGIEAPVNKTIVRLVRQAEAGGRKKWSGTELLAAIGG